MESGIKSVMYLFVDAKSDSVREQVRPLSGGFAK